MAHLICGIDLGAFSVKFAFLDVGFRATKLRGFMETAVPAGVRELARDERYWVGERESVASSPVQLTPSASGRPRTRR